MPTVIEINTRTGARIVREVALTAEQAAAGDAERTELAESIAAAQARQAALAEALANGSGSVTRAEVNALKAVLRERLL